MGKITDEAAFRVCASAKLVDQNGNGAMNYIVAPYLIDDLRAALSAASALTAGEREPVAWRARHSVQENWYLHTSPVGWWECQPLYTSPPASELEALRKETANTKTALDCALIREGNEKHNAEISRQNMNAEIRVREAAEARLAEALKALEPFACAVEPDSTTLSGRRFGIKPKHEHFVTARRVRDGGQADG